MPVLIVYGDIRDLAQAVSFQWSDVESGTSATDPRHDQPSKGVREHGVCAPGGASNTLALVMSRHGDDRLGHAVTGVEEPALIAARHLAGGIPP